MPAIRREGVAAAIESDRDRLIHIGLRRRTQQLAADQEEQVALANGQGLDIRLFDLHCGDDGVMIGYILIRNQRLHVGAKLMAGIKGRHLRRQVEDEAGRFRHVGGQIPAVRPGIGQQLLFIETLGIVKRLLCRVPENAVGLPL